jgi:protease I
VILVMVVLVLQACGDPTTRASAGVLTGKRVAILTEDGFEQSELLEPRRALREAGAHTVVVSPRPGTVRGWSGSDWGAHVPVDVTLADTRPGDYDALLLPGGVMNPDRLRMDPAAVAFVHAFVVERKPIAAICHGPWTLIDAGGVTGRTLTSWPSLRADLTNAGATWVDAEVFCDGNLVTSRKPADLPAFNSMMIQAFSGTMVGYATR